MFKRTLRKGFTLIELMIVVAIIGILASIAIPNFLKFQCKSKSAEGKNMLKSIYTAEVAYFGETATFADSFNMVGVDLPTSGSGTYFIFDITASDTTIFSATADGGTPTKGVSFFGDFAISYQGEGVANNGLLVVKATPCE